MKPHAANCEEDAALIVGELTHRFFNALQIIDSCLASASRSPDVSAEITLVRERVAGLARVNRLLTDGAIYASAVEETLGDVCLALIGAFGRTDVRLGVSIGALGLAPQDEPWLILLAVEMVTNVLKHRPGPLTILVDLEADAVEGFVLRVSDDGGDADLPVWTPKLATALAIRLGAALQLSTGEALAIRVGPDHRMLIEQNARLL